ncbi:unnamed protein product [Phytophthora fragariaefolia]|uniref:Unnamed protein product n=1 Tax=Phytophthora fragariaefolia TaxID=1490495 RepID=A0A9W6Y454_9STRA|nr:unnamed protein product [Phytophthora fragariaefolia]
MPHTDLAGEATQTWFGGSQAASHISYTVVESLTVTTAVINIEATNENQDEHEDAPDDFTEEETTEQEALSAALALISAPWHIPDHILFPGNGE